MQSNTATPFDLLANEELASIFEFLEIHDLKITEVVSKRFKAEASFQLLQRNKTIPTFLKHYIESLPNRSFNNEKEVKGALRYIIYLTKSMTNSTAALENKQSQLAILAFILQDCLVFLAKHHLYKHRVYKGEAQDEASRFLGPLGPNGIEEIIEPLTENELIDIYNKNKVYFNFFLLDNVSEEDSQTIRDKLDDLQTMILELHHSKTYNQTNLFSHRFNSIFYPTYQHSQNTYKQLIEDCIDKLKQQMDMHFPDSTLRARHQ